MASESNAPVEVVADFPAISTRGVRAEVRTPERDVLPSFSTVPLTEVVRAESSSDFPAMFTIASEEEAKVAVKEVSTFSYRIVSEENSPEAW